MNLDVSAAQIENVIGGALDGLARTIRTFDEYRGPQVGDGKKSLAVRVVLQRDDTTMTDSEADTAVGKIPRRATFRIRRDDTNVNARVPV